MDFSIYALLGQDGLVTGAIYALLAMALVLVFTVTHVPFIPIGCFVIFSALTLFDLQERRMPGLAYVIVGLGVICFALDVLQSWRTSRNGRALRRIMLRSGMSNLCIPVILAVLTRLSIGAGLPMLAEMALALVLTVQLGPMIFRIVYQNMLESDILTLFMLSITVDVALVGIGLVLFGPDGARTLPYSEASFEIGGLTILGQNLWVLGIAAALTILLFLFFTRSVRGKMLRATAINRVGAQLMGISIVNAGRFAFTVAAVIGAVCGLLIAPTITLNYTSGLMIGLKGFIAAVVGGFISYPIAAVAALFIGVLESFSSFWASAWKEVIVFVLIIPVLLFRSLTRSATDEGH